MTADAPGATPDYSNRSAAIAGARQPSANPLRGLAILRAVLGAAGVLGAVLLVVSTFVTVVQIRVLTATEVGGKDTTVSGADLHSVAMIVVAGFALALLVGAVRGARPAMAAVVVCGLLALGLMLGLDLPRLDDTRNFEQVYENASAGAASGFYLETLGAVLLLVSGGLMLILGADRVARTLTTLADRVAAAAATGVHRIRHRARAGRTARVTRADSVPPGRQAARGSVDPG